MIRSIRIAATVLLLLVGLAWGAAWFRAAPGEPLGQSFARLVAGAAPPSAGGVALPGGVSLGGPFALTDHTGRAVTDADYRGSFLLVFFGFTFCPDVCPTELQTVAAAMDLLGPQAARVRPLFITVDPARDTPAKLAEYVALFHPAITGLTGTPEQVAAVARAYRVYYARATPAGASEYLMDHSAFTYLMGPDGTLRTIFRPGVPAEEIAGALRAQLGAPARS
ncbi:SCO family protein [Roseomonas sp. CCTCC AB2023176]|uniref:SCO family protein n=1 Tax=Roseomonas sp. CCTCC AB2023176 TaxID=3342640 RepID=UPI0035D72160